MLAIAAVALGIVVQDHTPLRSTAQAAGTELTTLSQGDVLEIRGEQAGYLQVYNYRRERGGYLREDAMRPLSVGERDAPELLAVMRFLGESRGSEALGISYGAAYLKAVPAQALTAEPLLAIARMAERLADAASGRANPAVDLGAHLDVAAQSGIRMLTFQHDDRIRLCYDGELFRHVLAMPQASGEQRALAALGLTRADCIDPDLSPALRTALDLQRGALLENIGDRDLTPLTRSRLHVRRAAVWASIAFAHARVREPAQLAGQRALGELADVAVRELGEDRRSEYVDAVARVGATRWAAALSGAKTGRLTQSAEDAEPGQTCITLQDARPGAPPLVQRCTYGIPWLASAQVIADGDAVVLAVQPLETWRELWIFHRRNGRWIVDVLPPGSDIPDEGYIEYAGYVPATHRLLIAREVKVRGRFQRTFEELRLGDLVAVRKAGSPRLLADFSRWADADWRRDTLSLH